ncbi:hypothetical protein DL546_009127 [Coniochaeta pulveracea]|uniref:Tetracenomycin polyketide synthesis O-methyltransferase tcmP n=1 Tax=Coniochaeta pulveracea TaxID=177199 RepID=A0A420YHY3_9PEZI|nr:hypothetical protein DL546_009127 [Coniochaeta pulveracea]
MKDSITTSHISVASPPPVPDGAKAKITLHGAPKTLLVPLYCRSRDCQNERPILNDKWAGYVLQQIDFNFNDFSLTPFFCNTITLRARYFDQWTTDFLEQHRHQPVTVLHLACGLDARAHRVPWFNDNRDMVRWIDIDLPEVVELRRKLLPNPQGDYQLVAGSVLDDAVLNAVPNDRPTVVIFEGLIMYLEASDAENLIHRLCSRFERKGGELQFDGLGWMSLAVQRWSRIFVNLAFLKQSKAEWHYAIDDPLALEQLHPGLKLVSDVLLYDNEGIEELPSSQQWEAWMLSHLPGFRYISRVIRFRVLKSD